MTGGAPSAGPETPSGAVPEGASHRRALWYRILAGIAALLIVTMIGVTCVDVIGRYLLNRPFGGAFELTQILLAALVFVALPLASADGSHIEVDLALHLFSTRVQALLGFFAAIVSALALLYFTWRLVLIGLTQLHDGTRSASLMLPMAPLAFTAAASCLLSAVVIVLSRRLK